MPGIVLLVAVATLVAIGVVVRDRSPVISNATFILAAVLLVLAVLAFSGWV